MSKLVLIIAFAILSCTHLFASRMSEANDAFALKQYDRALSIYESIMAQYPTDPIVYYNAGTSALRQGNLAKAMLYLEKSYKYNPSDRNTIINISITKKKIGKAYLHEQPIIWHKWYIQLQQLLSSNGWFIVFVYFSLSILILLTLKNLSTKNTRKILIPSFLLLSILSLVLSITNMRLSEDHSHGIVMNSHPILYQNKLLTDRSKFEIARGQKCKLILHTDSAYLVAFPNGLQAYVPSTDVEKI